MKTLKLTLAFLVLAATSFAQTLLLNTTLSTAVATRATAVNLASVTNVVVGSDLVIDQEVMSVTSISGNLATVVRGYAGTKAKPHANSSYVQIVPAAAQAYAIVNSDPQGACARGSATITNGIAQAQSTLYLPIFNVQDTQWVDCIGGTFVAGIPDAASQLGPQFFPPVGAVLYTGLETNGTAFGAVTSAYCQTVDIQFNKWLTGAGLIMGTTAGGTERKAIALYDGSGNLLATQATGSSGGYVPAGTASVVARAAFLTPYFAVGPARYFACVWSNGTSDTIRHTITGTSGDQLFTSSPGTQTFGTYPATITVPTTFTTAQGPYIVLY